MSKEISQEGKQNSARDVLRQLAREMWVPSLIASAWTVYSLVATPDKRKVVEAITIFGGSFFLACWAFAQWFRVKKQQAVESGLGGIVKKQEALVAALTDATERLEGHASGGKSVGWLMLVNPRDGAVRDITAHVEGGYPLIDASASVLDMTNLDLGISEFQRTGNVHDLFKYHVRFNCGMLQPNLAIIQHQIVPCDTTQPVIRFRIDWTARNGQWTQFVELKRNGHKYSFYTAVKRGQEWVFESPQRDNIPKRSDGTPDVFWHAVVLAAA